MQCATQDKRVAVQRDMRDGAAAHAVRRGEGEGGSASAVGNAVGRAPGGSSGVSYSQLRAATWNANG